MPFTRRSLLALPLALLAFGALAQQQQQQPGSLQISQPWVRATVAQQQATGAFMQISSSQAGRLVAFSSPLAAVVEIHEMKMEGSVMKMRALPALELSAGQRLELKPGGYHLMMMGLKAPVKAGDEVPLRLVFERKKDGQRETLDLKATARAAGAHGPAH